MNIRPLPIVLIAAAGTLVGCKTMDHSAYIASVERMARMRGITVQWVHKPTKRHVDQ